MDQSPSSPPESNIYKISAERSPDAIFAMTEDLEMVYVNQTLESLIGEERDEIIGSHAKIFIDLGVVDQENFDAAIEVCNDVLENNAITSRSFQIELDTPDGRVDAEYRVAAVSEDEDISADLIGTIRDISERVEQKHRLQRQRDDLNSISQIQSLIQEIIQSFSQAPTRDAIRHTVCDTLANSEYYDIAWIAETGNEETTLSNMYAAGAESGIREYLSANEVPSQKPTVVTEALDTGRAQVITDIETSPLLPLETRELGATYGYNSLMTLPIDIEGSIIAVLTVGTRREHAFGGREREAFNVLGDLIAFALTAVEGKRLLLGEGAVELKFRLSSGVISAEISERYDCRLTLESVLPVTDRGCRCYFISEPAFPDEAFETTTTASKIDQIQKVGDLGNAARYEAILTNSPLLLFADAGANIVGGYAEDGEAYLTVQTTRDRDPEQLRTVLNEQFPDIELIAKQNASKTEVHPTPSQWIGGTLTERQRQMLEGAYYQGYFDWPRKKSAEEVAESFDISSSTFHAHVRKANKKVLSVIFEDT